jgi:hypothetical protein
LEGTVSLLVTDLPVALVIDNVHILHNQDTGPRFDAG